MSVRILIGDCRERLRELSDASVNCCVTSPPYFGLRDYGVDGQMGLEPTPDEFVAGMVEVFREVRRCLRDDGVLWLNIGDSYAGAPAGRQGESGQMADRSVAAARCRQASSEMIVRGKRDAKRWGGGNAPHGGGLKNKDLIGIPWMLAFALRADGWYLRQDIIWSKPNPMPESVRDRCTKAHEYLFLLSKGPRYFYDAEAITEPSCWDSANSKMPDGWDTGPGGHGSFHRNGREKGKRSHLPGNKTHRGTEAYLAGDEKHRTKLGLVDYAESVRADPEKAGTRNKRSVWEVATQPFSEAHFATYPPALIEPCILAGCPKGGTVIDPFFGAGTTGLVAERHHRSCIGIELNAEYAEIAMRRLQKDAGLFADISVERTGPKTRAA